MPRQAYAPVDGEDVQMRQPEYRDDPTHPDLNDYYSGSIPAPHNLSQSRFDQSPYPSFGDSSTSRQQASPYNPYQSNPSNNMQQVGHPSTYSDLENPAGQPSGQYNSGPSPWLEQEERSNRRSKYIVIGSIVGILVIIAVAVAVGVTVSNNNKHKSNSNLSTNDGGSATGVVPQTDPNDPSSFQKDSRLKQSFYGLAYSPAGAVMPDCGAQLPAIIEDIQLMSQLTKRIRLYGADCNVSALTLEAIKQTKVDMQVWLGNYVEDDDPTAYERQKGAIQSAIQTYGTDHIAGVTVGNEFILNYLNDHGGSDANDVVGNAGAAALIVNITDTRNMLTQLNVNLPVGTSDAGAYFNKEVLQAVDYGMSNVHPWFANASIDQAAGWTYDFFQEYNVQVAAQLSNNPQMYIAETGWPTASKDVGNESNGPSLASEPNLQIFIDDFVCQANANGTKYFFFEFFDEQWKDAQFGGVEGHWGLFYQNKTLKSITIPDCPI